MPYKHPREIERWNEFLLERQQASEREAIGYDRVGRDLDDRRHLDFLAEAAEKWDEHEREAARQEIGVIYRKKVALLRRLAGERNKRQKELKQAQDALEHAKADMEFLKRGLKALDIEVSEIAYRNSPPRARG